MKVPVDPDYLHTAGSEEEYWKDVGDIMFVVNLNSVNKMLHIALPDGRYASCPQSRQAFPSYLAFSSPEEVQKYERKNKVKLKRCGRCFPTRVWMRSPS